MRLKNARGAQYNRAQTNLNWLVGSPSLNPAKVKKCYTFFLFAPHSYTHTDTTKQLLNNQENFALFLTIYQKLFAYGINKIYVFFLIFMLKNV